MFVATAWASSRSRITTGWLKLVMIEGLAGDELNDGQS
jgi:hypothetical protein